MCIRDRSARSASAPVRCLKGRAWSVIEHMWGARVGGPLLGHGSASGAAGRCVIAEASAAGAGVERRLGGGVVLVPGELLTRVLPLDLAVHLRPGHGIRPGEALHKPEVDVAQLLVADAAGAAARVAVEQVE